jgi:hypothetical protein
MLLALRSGGRITGAEFEKRRDAWVTAWKARVPIQYHGYVWLHGYARVAETREDATRALEALGDVRLPAYTPKTLASASLGHTYFLAGRLDDALPLLERAAASCLALELPAQHTRAQQWLARAGGRPCACAAYRLVAAAGHATPRSVSADRRARARWRCAAR